jgi:spermidine synthase
VRTTPLLLIALVVATCGLVYELLAGTVASWVLGDSVTQFSTVVGGYLTALGLGSYLSRFVERELARRFVQIEIAVALVGGLTTPALFLAFAHLTWFRAALYGAVLACGTLVGLEIPILLRVLEEQLQFKTLVARVLAYDHLGSLLGSLLFSLVMIPRLGPLRTSVAFGMLNAGVALWSTFLLRPRIARVRGLRAAALLTIAALALVLWRSQTVIDAVEVGSYARALARGPEACG